MREVDWTQSRRLHYLEESLGKEDKDHRKVSVPVSRSRSAS